jgi:hypothetical protein
MGYDLTKQRLQHGVYLVLINTQVRGEMNTKFLQAWHFNRLVCALDKSSSYKSDVEVSECSSIVFPKKVDGGRIVGFVDNVQFFEGFDMPKKNIEISR